MMIKILSKQPLAFTACALLIIAQAGCGKKNPTPAAVLPAVNNNNQQGGVGACTPLSQQVYFSTTNNQGIYFNGYNIQAPQGVLTVGAGGANQGLTMSKTSSNGSLTLTIYNLNNGYGTTTGTQNNMVLMSGVFNMSDQWKNYIRSVAGSYGPYNPASEPCVNSIQIYGQTYGGGSLSYAQVGVTVAAQGSNSQFGQVFWINLYY